jgi:hypothetical protein
MEKGATGCTKVSHSTVYVTKVDLMTQGHPLTTSAGYHLQKMFTSPFVMPETLHTTTVISVPVNDVTQMW